MCCTENHANIALVPVEFMFQDLGWAGDPIFRRHSSLVVTDACLLVSRFSEKVIYERIRIARIRPIQQACLEIKNGFEFKAERMLAKHEVMNSHN